MTCAELRERVSDPASASQGGHHAVVEHLHGCADCRAQTRSFSAVDRLFSSTPFGGPPPDFARRLADRLALKEVLEAKRGGTNALSGRTVAGALLALALLAAAALFLSRPKPAVPPAEPVRAEATAGDSTGVAPDATSGPTAAALAQDELSAEERARVTAMFDAPFLLFLETLEGLDPLFPVDVAAESHGPPGPRPTAPAARAAESADARTERFVAWRALSAAEQRRLADLDASYRSRSEEQRRRLESRWETVRRWSPEELAGLKRLASRFRDLDEKRRLKLSAELRALAASPAEGRLPRWRAHPFAKTLTGQELVTVERLLLG